MINTTKITNKWLSFNVKVQSNLLTRTRLNYCFDQFWNTIIAPNLNKNNSALVQFKVLFLDQRVRSISYVQSVDINSHCEAAKLSYLKILILCGNLKMTNIIHYN